MCVCVFLYVCVCVYMHAHTQMIHTHTCTHKHINDTHTYRLFAQLLKRGLSILRSRGARRLLRLEPRQFCLQLQCPLLLSLTRLLKRGHGSAVLLLLLLLLLREVLELLQCLVLLCFCLARPLPRPHQLAAAPHS